MEQITNYDDLKFPPHDKELLVEWLRQVQNNEIPVEEYVQNIQNLNDITGYLRPFTYRPDLEEA